MAMASIGGLLGGIFKGTDTGESTRQLYGSTVAAVNKFENEVSGLSDAQLRDRTSLLKDRASRGDSLDSLLPVSVQFLRLFVFRDYDYNVFIMLGLIVHCDCYVEIEI